MLRTWWKVKKLPLLCLLALAILARADDAWFSAKLPINGKFYPVTARIHSNKAGDSIHFSSELQYRAKDTSFSMHTTGIYNAAKESPVWQNSIRDGLYTVEWSFRDYTEKPAAIYWRSSQSNGTTTFENDALPEEFLYFLTEKIDSLNIYKDLKVLSPVWEVPFVPAVWTANAQYTKQKMRFDGVDCYHVLYTREDGVNSEYYITIRGKQVWRFKTFRGVWFERVQ
ncbi:MAG: hypothetical protein LBQ87_07755 [Candidatus Fibromonas sp.]|nr:hypothetical protein [Candidatus Fibromonas sp.]